MMIMVSIGTFSWRSLRELAIHPKSFSVVMTGTFIVTVANHDLAKGMLTGVILSAVFFARKVGSNERSRRRRVLASCPAVTQAQRLRASAGK